jgi:alkylation response protein AidB-like acyl-CoA dehydrogenase
VRPYAAPVADIEFVLDDVVNLAGVLDNDRFAHVDRETVGHVLHEVARLAAEVVAPTNRDGDIVGTRWQAGDVVAAPGFASAYRKWVDTGYAAIPFDAEFGGAAFPWLVSIVVQEILGSANLALGLCPMLNQGAVEAIAAHGSPEQCELYLPKMVTGEWTGTMNLTEPQAGSDVGAITTRAERADDVAPGAWRITGEKIFITWGEHDMASNIIHLVLARTPGSPPGTKGISMFIVPKFLPSPDGSAMERNAVTCTGVEHKLGIHGSPTCSMVYDGAIGWLVGSEHSGMRNMFTMMNNARLAVAVQGLSVAERAYQQAVTFARERVQGRPAGTLAEERRTIIDHPDVRRLLMTQRAWIDAMRCLIYSNAAALDMARGDAARDEVESCRWHERAELLIPIAKSISTDLASELTSLAIQVHGGMGYIEETGVAQHYRDARITSIYEGTNGIQAADLVQRKLPIRDGAVVRDLLDEFAEIADLMTKSLALETFAARLSIAIQVARVATTHLLSFNGTDERSLLAASSPYLRMLGTTICGGLLGKAALAALDRNDEFHRAKVDSAVFFGEQILPTVTGLLPAIESNASTLFAVPAHRL